MLAASSGSYKKKAQSPPGSPQSWQVCLLEGCMWEQTKVPQEILRAAQAVDHALLLPGLLFGASLMLRDAFAGMLFSLPE